MNGLHPNPITSAENARRIMVLARVLALPSLDLMDALVWIDGLGKAPKFIPENDR